MSFCEFKKNEFYDITSEKYQYVYKVITVMYGYISDKYRQIRDTSILLSTQNKNNL